MVRLLAVLIIAIPGVICAYGIKLMRDAFFSELHNLYFHLGIQFTIGLVFFIGGLAFIGGFIFHRDKKRQLIKKGPK